MKPASVFCFLALLLVVSGKIRTDRVRYDFHKLIRVTPSTEEQLKVLDLFAKERSDIDWWVSPRAVDFSVDFLVSPSAFPDVADFLDRNFGSWDVLSNNIQEHIDADLARHENRIRGTTRSTRNDFHKNYHSIDEHHEFLSGLSQDHSAIARVVEVGKTYEGRVVKGIYISSRNSNSTASKPAIFLDGGIHAREWVSPATVAFIAHELLKNYESDTEVRKLVDAFDWIIVPVFNVDGYEYSRKTDRMWRKTRTPNQGSSCIGTDPNRNWDYKWDAPEGGSDSNPCSDAYRGPSPFSETSVKTIADYIKNHGSIVGYINFHSYSQFWMSPWGWTTKSKPDDFKDQDALSAKAVAAIKATHGKSFAHGPISTVIYVASGSSVDWTYGAVGIKYSYGVELRPNSPFPGFLLPESEILPSGEEIFASIKAMGEYISQDQSVMSRFQ